MGRTGSREGPSLSPSDSGTQHSVLTPRFHPPERHWDPGPGASRVSPGERSAVASVRCPSSQAALPFTAQHAGPLALGPSGLPGQREEASQCPLPRSFRGQQVHGPRGAEPWAGVAVAMVRERRLCAMRTSEPHPNKAKRRRTALSSRGGLQPSGVQSQARLPGDRTAQPEERCPAGPGGGGQGEGGRPRKSHLVPTEMAIQVI